MDIKIDIGLCIGCGLCADMCPQTFVMEADKASVVEGCSVTDEITSCCEDAASQCPTEAIIIKGSCE